MTPIEEWSLFEIILLFILALGPIGIIIILGAICLMVEAPMAAYRWIDDKIWRWRRRRMWRRVGEELERKRRRAKKSSEGGGQSA